MATYAAKGDRFEENTIKSKALDLDVLKTIKVEITNAEIGTLQTVGKIIIPHPGTDKYIEFLRATCFFHYDTGATVHSGDCSFAIGEDQAGTARTNDWIITGGSTRDFLQATEDSILYRTAGMDMEHADFFEDRPLKFVARNGTGDPNVTSSTSTITIKCAYRIHLFES